MKQLHLLCALLVLPLISFSQTGALEGVVYDAATQKPLSDAVIFIENSDLGAISEEAGRFKLRGIPAGEVTFKIALLGYEIGTEKATITAGKTTRITVNLDGSSVNLDEVVVHAFNAHNQQNISKIDIKLRPVVNSQEILRMVPGLFMGQHAGGGKAEQIFLRGFDIDHGTDIGLTVDGMPVNMVSHAHGQGYADLHFVIPELVEAVNFEKGPYHANKGNFVTAGWVDFKTREVLDRNFAKIEGGQYNTLRAVTGINLLGQESRRKGHSAYIAGEYSYSDSYFDAPQYFNRANVQARYSGEITPNSRLSLTGSHFWSRWNHSGQIPDRSVANGDISFFGSIDDTEGGETSRTNFNAQLLTQTSNGGLFKNQVFYSNYNFELYSNFTFFLDDPVNGDQIRQKEGRSLFGYNGSYNFPNPDRQCFGQYDAWRAIPPGSCWRCRTFQQPEPHGNEKPDPVGRCAGSEYRRLCGRKHPILAPLCIECWPAVRFFQQRLYRSASGKSRKGQPTPVSFRRKLISIIRPMKNSSFS